MVSGLLAAGLALAGCTGSGSGQGGRSGASAPDRTSTAAAIAASQLGALGTGTGSSNQGNSPWENSLQVAMPPDRVTRTVSAACRAVTQNPGWLQRENGRPASAGLDVKTIGARSPLKMYLSAPSAGCGSSVGVSISGPNGMNVSLRAYRLGWYHGTGARLVWQGGGVPVHAQPMPVRRSLMAALEANWAPATHLDITPAWTPGVYLIQAMPSSGDNPVVAPLVIRDDAGSAPLLVDESVLTWAAYNDFGGASLYQADGNARTTKDENVANRARTVGLARPLEGTGFTQMRLHDLTLVPLVEQQGIDAAYTTDVDIDLQPSQLLRHNAVIWGGHSEYWTRRMYDAVEAARNVGTNLGFLGGNNVYWQARLTDGPAGLDSRLTVYKSSKEDPYTTTNHALTSVRWDYLGRDSAELLGQSHSAIRVHSATYFLAAPDWLFGGTGIHAGSIVRDLLGGESDTTVPTNSNPPMNEVLGESVMHGPTWATATVTYYSAPSGAGVFAAGNMFWVCSAGGSCPGTAIPPAVTAFVTKVTSNLLRTFAQPRAGAAHPSTPRPPIPAADLRASLPPWAIGSFS